MNKRLPFSSVAWMSAAFAITNLGYRLLWNPGHDALSTTYYQTFALVCAWLFWR
jgi:hypothetical protein